MPPRQSFQHAAGAAANDGNGGGRWGHSHPQRHSHHGGHVNFGQGYPHQASHIGPYFQGMPRGFSNPAAYQRGFTQPNSNKNQRLNGNGNANSNGIDGRPRSRPADHYAPAPTQAPASAYNRNIENSQPMTPEERRTQDLVSALERGVIRRNEQYRLIWSREHSDSVNNLLHELQSLQDYRNKRKAAQVLIDAFAVLAECRLEGRLDPSQKGKTSELRETLINAVYDLCEDSSEKIRKMGYWAMKELSKNDKSLLKRNADVLVQLLQNEEPTEHDLIADALLEHLRISPISSFDVIIQDHCKGELRTLALSFLASPKAEKVLEQTVMGTAETESALASRLADIIPLANDAEMELIQILLRPLETLWLPSFDFATTEEYANASACATRLLINLVERFMKQSCPESITTALKEKEHLLTAVLESKQVDAPEVKDAQPLFLNLLQASVSSSKIAESSSRPQGTKYLKSLERQIEFAKTLLPASAAATTTTRSLETNSLHFFSHLVQVQLLRLTAHIAAMAVDASRQTLPADIGFSPADWLKPLVAGATKGLVTIFPAHPAESACPIFDVLLAEALLSVLVQVEPPVKATASHSVDGQIESDEFKDRLRYLYNLAQSVKASKTGTAITQEASKNVFETVREYLKPVHLRNGVHVRPSWMIDRVPRVPEDNLGKKREREEEEDKKTRTRRASEEVRQPHYSTEPQALDHRSRGRGGMRAPPIDDREGNTFSDDDTFSAKKSKIEEGISIRGGAAKDATCVPEPVSVGISIRGSAGAIAIATQPQPHVTLSIQGAATMQKDSSASYTSPKGLSNGPPPNAPKGPSKPTPKRFNRLDQARGAQRAPPSLQSRLSGGNAWQRPK